MLDLMFWLLFGSIFGWIASIIMADGMRSVSGFYVLVGVVGALLGGVLIRIAGAVGATGFNILSTLSAMSGSVVLVTILRLFNTHSPSK